MDLDLVVESKSSGTFARGIELVEVVDDDDGTDDGGVADRGGKELGDWRSVADGSTTGGDDCLWTTSGVEWWSGNIPRFPP